MGLDNFQISKLKEIDFNISKLTRRNITIWYLFAIPFFALIYWTIPNDFYHSTVKHEQYTKEEMRNLRYSITGAIKKSFASINGTMIIENEFQKTDVNKLFLAPLDIENE